MAGSHKLTKPNKLIAITSRHLAPLAMLRAQGLLTHSRSVAISFYAGEVEIVVCAGDHPRFLRTLRIGSDDPGSLAEQIGLEIQRSLSLLHEADVPASLELFRLSIVEFTEFDGRSLARAKLGTPPHHRCHASLAIVGRRCRWSRHREAGTGSR